MGRAQVHVRRAMITGIKRPRCFAALQMKSLWLLFVILLEMSAGIHCVLTSIAQSSTNTNLMELNAVFCQEIFLDVLVAAFLESLFMPIN